VWGTLIRALFVAALLLVAGCGGGGSDGDGDPATAVPADALFYAEAVVRPEGSLREDALAAAGKVLGTDDPEARLRELMRSAFEDEGEDFDYERDVEPWLGERAGFWVEATSEKDNFGVLLLEATDFDEARDSLRASLERGGRTVSERSHRGVEYLVNSEEVAAGVVGDFAAVGREPDLRRTIDAFEGSSLAEADAYRDAVDALEDERLAHFWADTPELMRRALAENELGAMVPLDSLRPLAGSFTADGDRLALELQSLTSGEDALAPWLAAGPTPLVQELPADAWVAGGAADLGEGLRATLDRVAGAFGAVALRREFQRDTGLDLDRDLLDWIGHAAFFVRGSTPSTVDGGLVVQPRDEERATDAFGRIVGALQRAASVPGRPVDLPGAEQAFVFNDTTVSKPIVFARGSGLVVLAFGVAAAEAALGSGERLGDTDAYAEAEELVGMEPSLMLSMPAVLELADAAGATGEPDFTEIRPYLDTLSVIAAGGTQDGDTFTARFAAGLR
jgi:uncharacterized protein DUF3352